MVNATGLQSVRELRQNRQIDRPHPSLLAAPRVVEASSIGDPFVALGWLA